MKKLKIQIYDSEGKLHEQLICKHIDGTTSHTFLHDVQKVGNKTIIQALYCVPATIDRWNMVDGLVTIYYKTGFCMEISRINEC